MMNLQPFVMCSRQEVEFRQACGEISVFEATASTADQPAPQRRLDPCRAVKKYRRSAAGISQEQQYPVRTLHELTVTVDYLTSLLITWPQQQVHDNNDNNNNNNKGTSSNKGRRVVVFEDLVNFLEDRIRAIQVDLVISGQAPTCCSCPSVLQYRLVQLHLLTQYLVSDSPPRLYEPQLGQKALQTALSSYWNGKTNHNNNNNINDGNDNNNVSHQMDDEILAWTCLIQLNQDLTRLLVHDDDDDDDDNTCNYSFGTGISAMYRKYIPNTTTTTHPYPCFQWSLQILVACNVGEWSTAMQLLQARKHNRFGILAACCMAHCSLPLLRYKALQAFNVTFGKGECIAVAHVARSILVMTPSHHHHHYHHHHHQDTDDDADDADDTDTSRRALDFCAAVHLPVNHEEQTVSFKTAPLVTMADFLARIKQQHFNNRDDAFVFLSNTNNNSNNKATTLVSDRQGFVLPDTLEMTELLQYQC